MFFERFQVADEGLGIMAIDGTHIRQAEFFEEWSWADEIFHRLHHFFTQMFERGSIAGDFGEEFLDF